ncbi:hypothetical protein GCM10023217_34280 [Gordonia alkaliphila]|uniref:Peptidoglycan DD-metalloendopeptidase family protein n=1 Tax=Gordonia alkaliphila TaxID=1053547 RepID=A0ABP8ZKB2_9ACTN
MVSLALSPLGAGSARAASDLVVPFESGVPWYVCQGYNGAPSHHGNLKYGLDMTTESARGRDGCWGNPNAATGRLVTSPGPGTATQYSGGGAGNWVCVRLDSGGSMSFMHLNAGGRASGRVSTGSPIGSVARAGESDNGGYAHAHLYAHTGSNCGTNDRVPFTGRFHLTGAPDLPYSAGVANQHAGARFLRSGSTAPSSTSSSSDLWLIKTRNTGSRKVEVHKVGAGSNYRDGEVHAATWFDTADQNNGYFQVVGNDLYFIKTRNTGSGKVEVHSATASSGYKSGQHHVTWFGTGDQNNGWFQMVGNELWFIKTKNTSSKRAEVHNATAASGYKQATVHAASWIGSNDEGNGWFQMVGNDLWFIKTKNTGSGKVEVHSATASSGYRNAGVHSATWLGTADRANGWFQMVGNDLWFIKTTNTGSNGKVEVHNATASSGYGKATLQTATWFSSGDRSNGWFQLGSK